MTKEVQLSPCWICGGEAYGIASSPLGAISGPYCRECLHSKREPWSVLVGALIGASETSNPDSLADWIKPVIAETLEFYDKTEEELWSEVERIQAELREKLQDDPAET